MEKANFEAIRNICNSDEYMIRVLVEVAHYIMDKKGNMLKTHIDTIETDSDIISKASDFNFKNKAVVLKAKEIRFYKNTNVPLTLVCTVKLACNDRDKNNECK